MLDRAQERVGRGKRVAGGGVDPAGLRQRTEHRHRAAAAQFGPPPAEDQLLRLHEELDLADAAAAELDVVAAHRQRLVAAHHVDLALHRVDVGDGGEIEVLAPDEGRQLREEPRACRAVSGDRPRLDEGRPLPILAERLVVVEGEVGGERDRGRAGIGPQPVVDAVDVALGGALLQELRDALRDLGEEGLALDGLVERRGGGVEEHDQIDVAGIVELAAAELAQAQDHEARAGLGLLGVGRVKFPRARGLKQERVGGGADRRVGEVRQGLRHGREVP